MVILWPTNKSLHANVKLIREGVRGAPSLTNSGIADFCSPFPPRPLTNSSIRFVLAFADYTFLCHRDSVRYVSTAATSNPFAVSVGLLLQPQGTEIRLSASCR
jgi:hypothetical protein